VTRALCSLILFSFLCNILPQSAFPASSTATATARASGSSEPNEDSLPIPETPSAPPTLFRRIPSEAFRCQRAFTYDGKTYGCDSNIRADGEGLRPFFKDIPEANIELNNYQRRKIALQNTAYFGTLGIAMVIAGFLWPNNINPNTGAVSQPLIRSLLIWGGAGVFAGSLAYGFTANRTNEDNLVEALKTHNDAKPDHPIIFQFSTGINL
jgi:hypothetical protein